MGETDFFSNAAADLISRWAETYPPLVDQFTGELDFLRSGRPERRHASDGDIFRLYCAGKVLSGGRLLNRFLADTRKEIGEPLYSYLLRFRKAHGFFSSFTVQKKLDEHLFKIHDAPRSMGSILYSKGCSAGRKRGCIWFFGFLCPGTACLHAVEPVLGFRGFSPDDLEYIAYLLDPGRTARGLAFRVFHAHPLPFLNLLSQDDPLPLIVEEEIVEYCSSVPPVSIKPGGSFPAPVRMQKRGRFYRYLLPGPHEILSSSLYLDAEEGFAMLLSASRRGYRTGAAFFADFIDIPKEPEIVCSTMTVRYVRQALKTEPHFAPLRDAFQEHHWEEEEFEARPPSFHVKSHPGKPEFPTPSKEELNLFTGFFSDNHLFILDREKKTEELYRRSTGTRTGLFPDIDLPADRLDEAPAFLEEAHRKTLGTGLQTMLLYTLFLLKSSGDHHVPVSRLGEEFLSIPWQHFNPLKGDADLLLSLFSTYVYTMFSAFDLAVFTPEEPTGDMVTDAGYSLASSDFFRAWLVWRDLF